MAQPTLVERVRQLGSRAALEADPRFAGIIENVLPLTGQLGNTRTRVKTLGEGSYGRVNLENVNTGQIAAKYFTDPDNVDDNVTELAVLKDLQGFPYVAQLVGVNTRPAALAVNVVAPAPNVEPLEFPVALMGKAKTNLFNRSLYTSWDDIERICIEVLKGIAIVHGQGIVHRDIKVENILMTAAKEVWISDFGKARYIDKNLPKTVDVYTGTLSTSAPELLLKSILNKKTPTDYEKSDMWSVGVTLYNIITNDPLFTSRYGRRDVLDTMFDYSGFPEPTDGDTYALYEEANTNGLLTFSKPVASYVQNVTSYKDALIADAVFSPADPARLETFATVIQSLLSYNPNDRPTALEALHTITGEDFMLPPRRSLLDQYVNTTPLPPDIADNYQFLCYEFLHDAYTLNMKLELPFTLDRALIYARAFLTKNLAFPPKLVFLVSFCIADILLDTSAKTNTYRYDEILDEMTGGAVATPAQIKEVDACINAFMASDIQFLGRTFFDDLVDTVPPLSMKQVQTLGLLNFVCHQYSIFSMYVGYLDVLKDRMLAYIADPANIVTGDYLRRRFDIGSGLGRNPVRGRIAGFVAFIRSPLPPRPPVPGGRRRMSRKKMRKSKRKTRYHKKRS
jgi:serine/threonine protein kinase